MKKERLIGLLFIVLILLSTYLFRFQILLSIGNYLIKEDPLEQADAMFVLSGRPFDRSMAAMDIFFQGYADKIVCLGSTVPQDLMALGYNYKESELIEHFLHSRMQIPKESIDILPIGTSTFEESEAILAYCKKNNFNKIIIVSSSFHTRRVHKTFSKKFKSEGIQTIIRGHIHNSEPPYWWQDEHEMINVNNEYIKIMYYWLKH